MRPAILERGYNASSVGVDIAGRHYLLVDVAFTLCIWSHLGCSREVSRGVSRRIRCMATAVSVVVVKVFIFEAGIATTVEQEATPGKLTLPFFALELSHVPRYDQHTVCDDMRISPGGFPAHRDKLGHTEFDEQDKHNDAIENALRSV